MSVVPLVSMRDSVVGGEVGDLMGDWGESKIKTAIYGCSCLCLLTGDLTSFAFVCGCVVNGVNTTAAKSVNY